MSERDGTKIEEFSQRLRRLRSARGLSQKEMAKKVGVAPTTYREWEYGRTIKGMPYPTLAEALGVSLTELMTGKRPDRRELYMYLETIEKSVRQLRVELESF